jgi:protein-export membrane protein SecD
MSNQKTTFSNKKKSRLIFSFIILFFIFVGVISGDSYYNNFTSWVSEKTNNTVMLPKIKERPFRLGLDLQGGVQLVYQADVSQIPDVDQDDLLEGVRDVIERRVNAFGVSEPVIQINKTLDGDYRVIVELAGLQSIDDAIKEIGETPHLEFKEQDLSGVEISEEDRVMIKDFNEGVFSKIEEIHERAVAGDDFAALAKEHNAPIPISQEDPTVGSENDGSLGWINKETYPDVYNIVSELEVGQISDIIETEYSFDVFKLEDKRSRESLLIESSGEGSDYLVRLLSLEKLTEDYLSSFSDNWINTELTGRNLKQAVIQFNPNDNRPEVSLEFDSEGAKLFEEITERNVGQPVAIYIDDYPISVPNVNEKISGGKAVISGNFTIDEARELVQRLKAGALPVPVNLINQKTVGASLGQKSIEDSLEAGIIGLILLAIFMIIIYRLPGVLAVFSLLIYGLTVLVIFKSLPILIAIIVGLFFVGLILTTFDELKLLDVGMTSMFVLIGIVLMVYGLNAVTLTLAGLAGFILSIGMAVDANVLIFERVKEESKQGRTLKDAIDEGIRRAWPSIRDGNISTLLICLVLINFGTGALKGFGTTLFIGVSISMFSAVVITRNLLNLFLGKRVEKCRFILGIKKKEKENIS